MTPPLRNLPLGLRLFTMFMMFLLNTVLVSFLAIMLLPFLFGIQNATEMLASVPQTPNEVNAFLFVQALSSIGGFIITALAFAQLQAGNASAELKLNKWPSLKMLVLGVFAVLVAQFFIDFLVELNKNIPLPAGLSFLNGTQKRAEDMINAVLNFKSTGQFIIVSVVLAVIPAVGEEMFFRGLLLGSLLKNKVHPAIAIIATGLIFSISHTEWDNSIAIWVLGTFLGYLYYVSGSLWLPIAVHFTNNFLSVLLKYLYNTGQISSNLAESHLPFYATIISFLIFVCCIFLFNKWKEQPDNDLINPDNQPIA